MTGGGIVKVEHSGARMRATQPHLSADDQGVGGAGDVGGGRDGGDQPLGVERVGAHQLAGFQGFDPERGGTRGRPRPVTDVA